MEFVNLTDLCKDFFWIMPQTPKYLEDGEIPYITSKNIKEGIIKFDKYNRISYEDYIKISKNREIIENDFLISMIGTLGEVAIVKKNDLPFYGQNMFLLRLNDELVDLRFIYYFLISKDTKSKLLGKQNKATQSYLRYNDVVSLKVPSYDKSKQIEIVVEISNILKLIDFNNKSLVNLDNIVKSQFIEMFGEIIDSKERECTFEDICNNMIGLTYNPGNVSDEGTIVLRSGNIKDGELQIESDVVRVCNVKIKDEKYVRDNDILMCSRNGSARLVGKTCIIHEPKEEMTFGAFMTIIRTKFPYILNTFMNMDYFRNQLTSTQTASVNQITTKMLNSYKMFKPTEEEENKFADFVQLIDKSKLNKVVSHLMRHT